MDKFAKRQSASKDHLNGTDLRSANPLGSPSPAEDVDETLDVEEALNSVRQMFRRRSIVDVRVDGVSCT